MVPKAQVADGQAAGLLGVVLEIGLDVLVGVVADDLGGVLGGAHQAVGPDAPELHRDLAGVAGHGEEGGLDGQVGHVVPDAHGEVVVPVPGQVLEDGVHVRRGGVLGGQAVPAADDPDLVEVALVEHGRHIQVQRLAEGAGLLGAVQHRQALEGVGQLRQQVPSGEGPVEVDLQHAHFSPLGHEGVHHLFQGAADGAHGHHHVSGVRGAVVVEGFVVGADALVDLLHVLHHDLHQVVVGQVGGLAVLEEGLRGLVGPPVIGVVGQVGLGVDALDGLPVHHVLQVLIGPGAQLLDLVGGAEAVEEVDEPHAGLDGGQVGHRGQVHDLLGAARGQHGHAGAPAGHHVLVVPEDGQGMGGEGPGGHVEHSGQPFAGDLIEVGDHQQQALGGGKRGGQRPGGQGPVDGAGGAPFGLHLHHPHRLAENVLPVLGGPLVHVLCHGGGGGDGVDGRHFGVGIGHVAGRGVGVHALKGSVVSHFAAPPFWAARALLWR